MRLKILNKNEKREIENKLKKQFGVQELPGLLIKKGSERIFIFQGSFNEKGIHNLESWTQVERVGVYFGKIIRDEIRLSIEGVHILQNQITKNIYELNESQAQSWMQGEDLQISTGKKEFLIIKHKNYFLGCGKASADKIGNYIPKARRLKSKSIIK